MSDNTDEKVVNLFSAHKKNKACTTKQVCESPEGYAYVTVKADDNGRPFTEEKLIRNASLFYYIVKVMIKEGKHPYINNFKVPAEDLLSFIQMYIDGKGQGQIIEIDKFYAEEWA